MRRRVPRPLPPGAAVLTVSVAGLAVLAGALAWTAPPTILLGDLAANEGARVAVHARVLRGGDRALTLVDETGRALAFPPAGARVVDPGDEVRAVGIVSRGAGTLLLSLESLDLRSRAPDPVLAVGDVARGIGRYAGTPVSVQGELARPIREGWRLADSREGASLRLDVAPVPDAWEPKLAVRIDGRLAFDERRLDYVLAVRAWSPS